MPCRMPKIVMEQGNVSRASPNALSRRIVLEPDLIHCSMVSSKMSAFRETGSSEAPGSGR